MSSSTWAGQATGVAPDDGPVEDDKIAPLLYSMAECLATELDATPGGLPCFVGVVPAALVAMDFCDCASASHCGMGWVRLVSVFPSRSFPTPTSDVRCLDPLAAQVTVGVTRCLPGMDARGNPPTVAAQAEAVRVQMADMMAIRRAIACCLTPGSLFILGSYTPLGPAGDCGGGEWAATIQVP